MGEIEKRGNQFTTVIIVKYCGGTRAPKSFRFDSRLSLFSVLRTRFATIQRMGTKLDYQRF